ncbi:MAG: oligopeptide/dipeptide ABC transporter ATP-binding protein [Eubacteriales bacterium]|nr:ATP-binding cassette domain-containing protein [Christensenellaceae bacterium]MDY5719628.1 oligopeptide/dipeptide ABC transporter ATP-binding protein [Eubacteriales bacterium]
MAGDKLLQVENLTKYFYKPQGLFGQKKQIVKSVDHVTFDIMRNETLGLVGESGCGKTTVGRTITRLYEPTDGKIIFDGKDISHLTKKELLPYRKKMQMIFQDPYASLNARMTVMDIIREALDLHSDLKTKEEKSKRVYELLDRVGLMREHANRYPHELSGGQRQRIGIARALAVDPEFIVCDEPISALDVSIQAQVVNMLEDLQREFGLTYLFIAHDLSMVRHISDRIGVMYLGKLVEIGPSEEIYSHHLHPYTEALLSSVPVPDPEKARAKEQIVLQGDIPSPIDPPSGCRFRTRCPRACEQCAQAEPELKPVGNDHFVACHLVNAE